MNSAVVAIIGLAVFYLAYRYYSPFIAEKVFGLDDSLVTPANEFSDGKDFVPTPRVSYLPGAKNGINVLHLRIHLL